MEIPSRFSFDLERPPYDILSLKSPLVFLFTSSASFSTFSVNARRLPHRDTFHSVAAATSAATKQLSSPIRIGAFFIIFIFFSDGYRSNDMLVIYNIVIDVEAGLTKHCFDHPSNT